jgi:rubrerythrin
MSPPAVPITDISRKRDIASAKASLQMQHDMRAAGVTRRGRQGKVLGAKKCAGCGVHYADPPSELCPGCEAYRGHQR